MSPRYAARGSSDEQWVVRPVRGQDARKTYRCPGCDHEIRIGQPHVVVWRDDWFAGPDDRRHWHTACWRQRMPTSRGFGS
jgi:hypothetical protein